MTITELYEQLKDKDFQDPTTGNLFFPAYMYLYDPAQEYQIQDEIANIKDRLHRPTAFLDVLVLNIFQEFLEFLKSRKFGQQSLYEFFLEREKTDPEKVNDSLKREATRDEFFLHINQKIQEHLLAPGEHKKTYVFIHGFGQIFPYLRASKFLSNFEKYIQGYKIIMFYPGTAKDYYSLFGLLNDEHAYRSIKLINESPNS